MIKTRRFNLVRVLNAKRLTQGPYGFYLEIDAVLQEEPGDI